MCQLERLADVRAANGLRTASVLFHGSTSLCLSSLGNDQNDPSGVRLPFVCACLCVCACVVREEEEILCDNRKQGWFRRY